MRRYDPLIRPVKRIRLRGARQKETEHSKQSEEQGPAESKIHVSLPCASFTIAMYQRTDVIYEDYFR